MAIRRVAVRAADNDVVAAKHGWGSSRVRERERGREQKSATERVAAVETRLCFSVINDALYEADKHTHAAPLPAPH